MNPHASHAWKDVRAAWKEVKESARPNRWLLTAIAPWSVFAAWSVVASTRWMGLVNLPWWLIPILAMPIYWLSLVGVANLSNALLAVFGRDDNPDREDVTT